MDTFESLLSASTLFAAWAERFGSMLEKGAADDLAASFSSDGYWKDYLAFSWEHRFFSGQDEIRLAFSDSLARSSVRSVTVSKGRTAPYVGSLFGKSVVQGFIDFEINDGRATAFVCLLPNSASPADSKVWLMVTTLQELIGFEERAGRRRPTGEEYARNTKLTNWDDDRRTRHAFADRDPEVLIIGAGQGGLILGARLKAMGVDVLHLERTKRVGDTWRSRYHSLTLHNETAANHFPFMPFPETWPTFLSKDEFGDWLEYYAGAMDLNIWTDTTLISSTYDDDAGRWSVLINRAGKEQTLQCKHLVAAIGVTGTKPKRPDMPGLSTFKGEVLHSHDYRGGVPYKGKRALVVGAGNSGHDVAQDLYMHGGAEVYMHQRGATCVISLVPSARELFSAYSSGIRIEDVDIMNQLLPYPLMVPMHQTVAKKCAENDRDLIEGLHRAGFETTLGSDDTGFYMKWLRGEPGYYINVGGSELIVEGKVKVINDRDISHFVEDGLMLNDGTLVPLDLVVQATGFENMQQSISRLVGEEIAEKVGPIWGFDQDYQMRSLWRRTAQDHFWVMGGGILEARIGSLFMALEIKADLEGILPSRAEMPIVRRTVPAAAEA